MRRLRTNNGYRSLAVAFSPDGTRLVFSHNDATVRVWRVADWKQERSIPTVGGIIRELEFSPDGLRLAATSVSGTATVWDPATGNAVEKLRGHAGSVFGVGYSRDGGRLATAAHDGTVRLWDTTGKAAVAPLRMPLPKGATACRFSPDGTRLAGTQMGDETVYVWNTADGSPSLTLRGGGGAPLAVAFSPDGSRLASGATEKTIQLWDARTGRLTRTLREHPTWVLALAFTSDGRHLLSSSRAGDLRVWDLEGDAAPRVIRLPKGHQPWAFDLSRDGKRIVTANDRGDVTILDFATGTPLAQWRGHIDHVFAAAFSPDGSRVATGSGDGVVGVWDAATGAAVHTLRGHAGAVKSVGFSPDGSRLASGSSDGIVRLWDAATGDELLAIKETGGSALDFSPNGVRLATVGRKAVIWDARGETEVARLRLATSAKEVRFSNDGRRLVARDVSGAESGLDVPAASGPAPKLPLSLGGVLSPDGRFEARFSGCDVRLLARTPWSNGFEAFADRQSRRAAAAKAYHAEAAAEAERRGERFAAEFHRKQLAAPP